MSAMTNQDWERDGRMAVFLGNAADALEFVTARLERMLPRLPNEDIVVGMTLGAATAMACGLLLAHGQAVESRTEPHWEMCERLKGLESQGLAPEGAARVLAEVEGRAVTGDLPWPRQLAEELSDITCRLHDALTAAGIKDGRLDRAVVAYVLVAQLKFI